jgi:SAM-dependent methyltransferase
MPKASWDDILPLVNDDWRASVERSMERTSGSAARFSPVLVHFDRSVITHATDNDAPVESDISREDFRGPKRILKRMVSPVKSGTLRNFDRFVQLVKAETDQPVVLIVGGGSRGQGTDQLYRDADLRIVSFDIYHSPNVHFVADAHDIPLADGTCDGVVIQAVLEHVLEPERVAAEIFRVLKPGGVVYSETPFMQQVHEGAYDFTRFTESGHRYLFRSFDRVDSGSSGGPGTTFIWAVDYLFRSLFRSRMAGRIAKLSVFWVRYLDRLIPEAYAIDGASGVFFLGIKSNRVMGPKDAVTHYLGAQGRAAQAKTKPTRAIPQLANAATRPEST